MQRSWRSGGPGGAATWPVGLSVEASRPLAGTFLSPVFAARPAAGSERAGTRPLPVWAQSHGGTCSVPAGSKTPSDPLR